MTNQTIWSRIHQMFNAPQHECDDPLRELLFRYTASFVESKEYRDTNWRGVENGIVIKDFLSDAYTYITRDRPLKVDRCIAEELAGNSVWTSILETDDSRYMQGIISFRKFLF
jgi:hypothetical protein